MTGDATKRGAEHALGHAPGDAAECAVVDGLELLREGRFFEAHERFEEGWRVARDRPRTLLHALAQLAASYHQLDRGRGRAAARTWEKARRKLASVDALSDELAEAVAALFTAAGAAAAGPSEVDPDRLPARNAWPVPAAASLAPKG